MKSYLNIALAAALVVLGAPAFADTQVKASPGVTLTEAAQAKFNADTRPGDRHVTPVAGTSDPSRQFYASAGLTIGEGRAMSLEQVFVAKHNRENGRDNDQAIALADSATMGSRAYGQGADYNQLAASAGLDAADISGMSLTEIAAAKFAKESGDD